MAKVVTKADLGEEEEEQKKVDFEEEAEKEKTNPEEDSFDNSAFVGGPFGGKIGADAIEEEVEAKKERQKEAEEAARKERLAGEEGDKEEEGSEEQKAAAKEEKRLKDAQRKIHEQATQLKKMEVIVNDLQKRVDEAAQASPTVVKPGENPFDIERQKIADEGYTKAAAIAKPAPPDDREAPDFKEKWDAYVKAMDDYNRKVSLVWVDTQTKISKLTQQEERQAETDKKAVMGEIEAAIKAVGEPLINEDGEIEDGILDLYWAQSVNADSKKSIKDQIKETAERCKSIVERIRGKEKKRAQKDKEDKESLQVLGRGANLKTKKEEPETPLSLKDIRRGVLDNRRARGVR